MTGDHLIGNAGNVRDLRWDREAGIFEPLREPQDFVDPPVLTVIFEEADAEFDNPERFDPRCCSGALFKTLQIEQTAGCHRLSEEPVGLVPFDRCTRRPGLPIARRSDELAMHGVVVSPVLEIGLKTLADLEPRIVADRHVPLVE